MSTRPNFKKIFAPVAAHYLRRKARSDDRQLDVSALTDEQLDRLADELDDSETDIDDGGNLVDSRGRQKSRHPVEALADLLTIADPTLTKQRAVHHLLHTPNGAAIVHRLRKALKRKENKPMETRMEKLEKFVKANGMLGIAKHIVDGGEAKFTEAEFTKLATEAARFVYPNDRPDKAFSKYFEGNEVLRKAHAIVKGTLMPLLGVYVGGDAATGVNDPEDALQQIEALVAQMRAASPEMAKLTKEQVFAKAYASHPELARAERRQSRARLGAVG